MTSFFGRLAAIACLACLCGCTGFKPNPVTWEDIASTIPANPDYIASLNLDFEADSVLNNVWGDNDMAALLTMGLNLDTVRPPHVVVARVSGTTYVTWPLQTPRLVNDNLADWPTASLNNTVDAHMRVLGDASIVISSTQAWVVNSEHGADNVNDLLSAAMNTKAVHVQPYARCIASTPKAATVVVPYENRYYVAQLNHEDGLVRVDVDAYNKADKRIDLVQGLGRLPYEFINDVSPRSPFAAIQIDKGSMPRLIVRLAKLSGKKSIKLASQLVAPLFEAASGTVTAFWDTKELKVRVPFDSREAVLTAKKSLETILKTDDRHFDLKNIGDILEISTPVKDKMPEIGRDRMTPHLHSQTENPAAIAFARFDLKDDDSVTAYFELAPSHARLQIDFKESATNLAETLDFIKTIIFRVL